MSRVVVTGTAGRIGATIARRLKREGRLLAGIDVVGGEHVTHVVDLCGAKSSHMDDIMRGADGVIHAAAHPGPAEAEPAGVAAGWGAAANGKIIGLEPVSGAQLTMDNLASTMAVFDAAVRAGVGRVVFSSTAFTHGWCHDPTHNIPVNLPMAEVDGPTPYEHYGLSKQCCENLATMLARTSRGGTGFVSLRFTNIVKRELFNTLPWPAPPTDPPRVPEEATKERPPLPLVFWAWTHEDDVIDAHMSALDLPGETVFAEDQVDHAAFLLAAPSTRFAEPTEQLLTNYFGKDAAAGIPRAGPILGNASIFDASKANRLLGWQPRCWTNAGNGRSLSTSAQAQHGH